MFSFRKYSVMIYRSSKKVISKIIKNAKNLKLGIKCGKDLGKHFLKD